MAHPDGRCFPIIELESAAIRALFASAGEDATNGSVACLDTGLINTIYRWTPALGGAALALRVFAAGPAAFETEHRALACIAASLPVPEVVHAARSAPNVPYPYSIYRWIEGVTLNECRRQAAPGALQSLAEPLGALLARVAAIPFVAATGFDTDLPATRASRVTTLLELQETRLKRGKARTRLGGSRADALWRQLEAGAARFGPLDHATGLVHGDCGGRNILVRPNPDGTWSISGLIDWEMAFSGWGLWDVGSLFRYRTRYDAEFRLHFERGYRKAGGTLPSGWWHTARLLDATRNVETLNGERELPVVFEECREVIATVIDDGI